jgi:hypothetical protein
MVESFWRENKKNWKDLLFLVNADIESMSKTGLQNLINRLIQLQTANAEGWQILEITQAFGRIAVGLMENPSEDMIRQGRQFFGQLQGHLQSRIHWFMTDVKSKRRTDYFNKVGPLAEANFHKHEYRRQFEKEWGNKDPLWAEKCSLDISLTCLPWYLCLNPSLFRRCKRCQQLFCPRKSKKRFCSLKCERSYRTKRTSP